MCRVSVLTYITGIWKRRGREEEEMRKRRGREEEKKGREEEYKRKNMYVPSVCEAAYSLIAEPRIGSVENTSSLANVG